MDFFHRPMDALFGQVVSSWPVSSEPIHIDRRKRIATRVMGNAAEFLCDDVPFGVGNADAHTLFFHIRNPEDMVLTGSDGVMTTPLNVMERFGAELHNVPTILLVEPLAILLFAKKVTSTVLAGSVEACMPTRAAVATHLVGRRRQRSA